MPPLERQRRLAAALQRWRRGEDREASFRDLASLLYPPLHGYFVRQQFSVDEAHDLTQESLVGIYKGLASFRAESRLTTWAFAIAKNTALKARRAQQAQKRGEPTLPLDDQHLEGRSENARASSPSPLQTVLDQERRDKLRQAVETLPPRMRAAFTMHLYQERSRGDIADALGVSPETVKTQLAEARRRLAEALLDPANPEDPS